MNTAFGAGNWNQFTFENAVSSGIFTPGSYTFLFFDGGDQNGTDFANFLSNNESSLQTFVSDGGSVFLDAAQNTGPNTINTGLGATLEWGGTGYPYASSNAYAVNTANAIFNTPNTPVGTSWTGNYFSHDAVAAGTGFTPLITSGSGDTGNVILTGSSYGAGYVLVGGMSTTEFHSPQPQADNLLANILVYGADAVPTISSVSPTAATKGSSAITLTVTGTNFVSGATVDWNGAALTTTYSSSTQLQATIPASDLTGAGTFTVTVVEPDGSASNGQTFTVNAALAITTTSLPGGTASQSYSQTIATSGGTSPITVSVTSGSLPTGLSLASGTGAITGTLARAAASPSPSRRWTRTG